LGYGGILSPVIAAWAANFIFACFAIFNLVNAE
jgi:lipopolysaccharide export LptBFGC system permease protein LptF